MSPRLTVDEVAEAIGVSRRQLQRIFADGRTTFTAEVHKALIARAERILLTGTVPVSDIAQKAGYRHAGHFAKIFKRHRHVRPDRLRRRTLGRHARRIGGLRGTALFEGRLSPREVRIREAAARDELQRIEANLNREIAHSAAPGTSDLAFGMPWPAVIASILEAQLARLLRDIDALDRRAWRERGQAASERRSQLLKDIKELQERVNMFKATVAPN